MDILLIEDEYLLADELEDMILGIEPSANIKAKLTSIEECVEWLPNNYVDLIFLDVQLSDGLSFSIFDQIKVDTPVIFTTAYDRYAIKAFDVNSIAYLLKPIDELALKNAIDKFKSTSGGITNLHEAITWLMGHQKGLNSYKNRILLHMGSIQKPVEMKNISYFMADDKYLYAILNDGKRYFYDSTLSKLENEVDPNIFFRINRKYLININSVVELIQYSNSRIKVKIKPETDEDVLISYARNNDFREWLNK